MEFYKGFCIQLCRMSALDQEWRLYAMSAEAMAAANKVIWVNRSTGYWVRVHGNRWAIRRMLDGVLDSGPVFVGRGVDLNGAWSLVM